MVTNGTVRKILKIFPESVNASLHGWNTFMDTLDIWWNFFFATLKMNEYVTNQSMCCIIANLKLWNHARVKNIRLSYHPYITKVGYQMCDENTLENKFICWSTFLTCHFNITLRDIFKKKTQSYVGMQAILVTLNTNGLPPNANVT